MNKILIIQALEQLNEAAKSKGIKTSFYICGGASLILQGITSRSTKDIDVIEPDIPADLEGDIIIIARKLGLGPQWINIGPSSIVSNLPVNWKHRVELVFEGDYIEVYSISREDIIFSKFWAMCDRQQDADDLCALVPSKEELDIAFNRVVQCDGNPKWPEWVKINFDKIKKRLGHE